MWDLAQKTYLLLNLSFLVWKNADNKITNYIVKLLG